MQLKELYASPYDRFARGIIEKAYTTSGMTRLPLLPRPENSHQRGKRLGATFPGVIRGDPVFLTTIDNNKLVMTGRFLQFYEGKIESEARMLIEKSHTQWKNSQSQWKTNLDSFSQNERLSSAVMRNLLPLLVSAMGRDTIRAMLGSLMTGKSLLKNCLRLLVKFSL